MKLSRRRFLAAASVAVAGPALGIEPIKRTGKSQLKSSLAAYSFREYLDLKKPTMNLMEFAEFAAAQKIDAIEPTAYYFADQSTAYMEKLKAHCKRLGLDISGTAVGNDFCHPEAEKHKAQIQHVKDWVDRAAAMGAKTIRIFAGTLKKGDNAEKAIARAVAAIEECCEYAKKSGVYLALENHGGITATPEEMLKIVRAVKHPMFGVNVDTGNFHTADPYVDLEKIIPYAVTVQVKTEIQKAKQQKEEADLPKLIEMLRKAEYSGYVVLEYEAKESPKMAVPRYLATLRKLLA
jgi:sugar phosphate isomerase/epimerase